MQPTCSSKTAQLSSTSLFSSSSHLSSASSLSSNTWPSLPQLLPPTRLGRSSLSSPGPSGTCALSSSKPSGASHSSETHVIFFVIQSTFVYQGAQWIGISAKRSTAVNPSRRSSVNILAASLEAPFLAPSSSSLISSSTFAATAPTTSAATALTSPEQTPMPIST